MHSVVHSPAGDPQIAFACSRTPGWQAHRRGMTDHALHPHTVRPPLRPEGVADFLDVVPYLLGFQPRDSLVLAGLRSPRRRVGATLRVDLQEARGCPKLPPSLAAFLQRDGASEAFAVIYGEAAPESGTEPGSAAGDGLGGLPDRALVAQVSDGLAVAGLGLVDALYVAGDRWWSYACQDAGCCPPGGRLLPAAGGRVSAAVAAATYAGMVALPSREALAQTLDPSDQVSPEAVEEARLVVETERAGAARRSGGLARWRSRAVREFSAVLLGTVGTVGTAGADPVDRVDSGHGVGRRLDEREVARLVVLLTDVEVRDDCAQWTEGAFGERALDLWRQLARRAVPPYDVAPCVLVAWSAWQFGAGPLARIAVDRALASDPECRLALLVEEILDRGTRPTRVRLRPAGRRRGRAARLPPDGGSAP